MMRAGTAFLLLLSINVSAYAAEKSSPLESIQDFCTRNKKFSVQLDASAKDSSIKRKFQGECSDLTRQDGLDFGPGLTAYECRTLIGRQPAAAGYPAPTNPNLSALFGRKISYDLFSDDAATAQDLQHPSETSRMPLAHLTTSTGINATFIILANDKGEAQHFLFTNQDVKANLKQVRNLGGAADLLSLLGLTGERPLSGHDFAMPVCKAAKVEEGTTGWKILSTPVNYSCAASELLDYEITRTGQAKIIARKPLPEDVLFCVD